LKSGAPGANRTRDKVNQFSRFGKVKTAAWNLFAQHIQRNPIPSMFEPGDGPDVKV
jgi:hypothetical protein